MPTVIHIGRGDSFQRDFGEDAEQVAQMLMDPGESGLYDAMKRLGYQVKFEQAPDKPRELSDEAKRFIASYQREDPVSVLAVYWRYYSLDAQEFDTVEEAESFLETGADDGSLAGEAIVDADGGIKVLD